MNYIEEMLEAALRAKPDGQMALRKPEIRYNVSRSTLRRRRTKEGRCHYFSNSYGCRMEIPSH